MQNARDYLKELYLDWRNNYLTIEKFAEHNGITKEHAEWLLLLAQNVNNSNHPES